MLSIFIFFSQSQVLYLNPLSNSSIPCTDLNGCNYEKAKEAIQNNDVLRINSPEFIGDAANEFLTFINSTTSKNISILSNLGKQIVISKPNLGASEFPAIYAENSSFLIDGFIFDNFSVPVFNGISSSFSLSNLTFINCDMSKSALLGFIESQVNLTKCIMINNTANTQSLVIGLNTQFSFQNSTFKNNFLQSQDIRAAFHFLSCNISISSCYVESNMMKLPFIAVANSSQLTFTRSYINHGYYACLIACEFNATVRLTQCNFSYVQGGIIATSDPSIIFTSEIYVCYHNSEEVLFGLINSTFILRNSTFTNSSFSGIVFSSQNNNVFTCSNINVTYCSAIMPLFACENGRSSFDLVLVKYIQSQAEIVVASHQGGEIMLVERSKFTHLKSTALMATALSALNGKDVKLHYVILRKNDICGGLFENQTIIINHGLFSRNKCLPQGESLPLAIITASISNNTIISESVFTNNSALTGSFFGMNSTFSISNSTFEYNEASHGAGVCAVGSNVTIAGSNFSYNIAQTFGGGVSLMESNSTIINSNFTYHQAPNGAAISVQAPKYSEFNGIVSKRNTATHDGSFVYSMDEKKDTVFKIIDSFVDDEFSKAIYIKNPDIIDFSGSKFNCKLRCMSPGKFTPKPQEVPEQKDERKNENQNNDNGIKYDYNKNANENDDSDVDLDELNDQNVGHNYKSRIIWWLLTIPILFLGALVTVWKLRRKGITTLLNSLVRQKGHFAN